MGDEILVLLALLSVWDLWKQNVPIGILIALAAVSLWRFIGTSPWTQFFCLLSALITGGVCRLPNLKGKAGTGDVWVLICLAAAWPMGVYWPSIVAGGILLSITAVSLWFFTRQGDEKIPLIPFLFLGYWVRGFL